MTTVRINLPDQLTQEVQSAGLFTPATPERILREYPKARKIDKLFAAMDRMAAVDEPAMMPEEIAEELRAMRPARRQSRQIVHIVLDTNIVVPGFLWDGVPRRLLQAARETVAALHTHRAVAGTLRHPGARQVRA